MSLPFENTRSPVYGTRGMVGTSQPLASEAGMTILKMGGNAVDAAVASAAALNVVQPHSTGIGGDCFCLFYNSKTKEVKGLNGSGRCASGLTIDKLKELGIESLPPYSPHTVTVPGAAAGWVDSIEQYGSGNLNLAQILQPAIELAEKGFPVSPISAKSWEAGVQLFDAPNNQEMLITEKNGKKRAPKCGEIFKNPTLAETFRLLAKEGKKGFYSGRIAESIVKVLSNLGGVLSLQDLTNHESTFDEPISVNYKGVDVWEIPPNGQGITALMALNILENFDLKKLKHNSTEYLHILIESLRLSFADTRYYVADPIFNEKNNKHVPIKELLSKDYAKERSKLINLEKASNIEKGDPVTYSSTVYLSVIDGQGNACSFINSNYMGFGTGIIPKGCGFTLHNRGHNFSLEKDHPNCLEPGKRPYHTIIPGMATKDGNLFSSFGVMGGFMQPQGHVQVLLNMIDFDMDPQSALDAARFCILDGSPDSVIVVEPEIEEKEIEKLKKMGHLMANKPYSGMNRLNFGNGQILNRVNDSGVIIGGSDLRCDGVALPW